MAPKWGEGRSYEENYSLLCVVVSAGVKCWSEVLLMACSQWSTPV